MATTDGEVGRSGKRITRRSALKTGAAVASGLAFGGSVIGTAGASRSITTGAFPVHHYVRAMDDPDPGSPIPDPQDLLVERRGGYPVDDGDVVELDGTHQLRWGEFRAVQGTLTAEPVEGGTEVSLRLTGLVPDELYTFWLATFEPPGFVDTRELGGVFDFVALQNMIGVGALGAPDGTENIVRARGSTGRLDVLHPEGDLSMFGSVGNLLDEYEAHVVGVFHLDDETWGPVPEPVLGTGTYVEQPGFSFGTGVS